MDYRNSSIYLCNLAGIRVRYRLLVTYHVALYSGIIVYIVVQKNNQKRLTQFDYIFFSLIVILALIGLLR